MGNVAPTRIQSVGANFAKKRMPNTFVKQRLVIFALEHPNVLKGLFKTRHYYTATRQLISGTGVDVRIVLRLSKKHGGKGSN